MKIIQKFSEDDKKELEHLLSLQYCMPYVPLGNRKLAHKVIYILTPVLYETKPFNLYLYFKGK